MAQPRLPQLEPIGYRLMPGEDINSLIMPFAALTGQGGIPYNIYAQFLFESSSDGLAALGTTQATALPLTTKVNRVTTSTVGSGVALPTSAAGMQIVVVNTSPNPIRVYSAAGSADTINSVAATGVLMPANSVNLFACPVAGQWFAQVGVGFSGSLFTESSQDGATAVGTSQATALQLTAQTTRITTAVAGAGVNLPASAAGLEIAVVNTSANPIRVYPAQGSSDTINGVSAATGILMPVNSVDIFFSPSPGVWFAEVGVGFSGSLFTESSQDNITAFAGGGKVSATPIIAQTSRITTVATAGDSILLPPSAPGLEIMVINHGANAMQVFGSGTDQIDDVATGTGVSQMANSLVIYTCATTGNWYTEGLATGFVGGYQTMAYASSLTAAGTTQATALQLTSMINRVTTAAAGSGVVLPPAYAGLEIAVTNRGANPITVYGNGTDTINGAANVAQMVNSVTVYVCSAAGIWETDGVGQGFAGNFPTVSTTNGITATAAGTQATALTLTTVLNRVTTVATANDAVKLPPSTPGLQITVYNAAAANSLNVFPNTGDAINALAVNTAFAVAAGKNVTFGAAVAGQWHAILSA